MSLVISDYLKLEIQEGFPDLPNIVLNPSGNGGAWGWYVGGSQPLTAGGANPYLQLKGGGLGVAAWTALIPEVTATGQQVGVSMEHVQLGSAATEWRVRFAAPNNGALIGSDVILPTPLPLGFVAYTPINIPVGTGTIHLILNPQGSISTDVYRFRQVSMIHGATADVAASDPLSDPPWTNVLGSAYDITLERQELDLGTLTAHLRDADLDPAANLLIRPGKRWRIRASIAGTFQTIATGTLNAPLTKYDLKDPTIPDDKRTDVTVTGTDDTAKLSAAPRPDGVAGVAELSSILLGVGIPHRLNGSDNAIVDPSLVPIVSRNENASALDQVAITRTSNQAAAWIDGAGVLNVAEPAYLPLSPITLEGYGITSGFEVDAAGWGNSTNATIARVTSNPPPNTGVGLLRLTSLAAGNMGGRTDNTALPVVPGATYRATAMTRHAAGMTARSSRLNLLWRDSAGAALSSTTGTNVTSTATYALREVSGVAPAGAAYVSIQPFVVSTAAAGEIHGFDDFTFEGVSLILDESDYSELELDFDLERCINTVKPKLLRLDATTGGSEEISLGPYTDPTSVREWGERVSEPTVHGILEADVPDWAADLLTANATPAQLVTGLTLPIKTTADITAKAGLDLVDLIGVTNARAAYAAAQRVAGLKHSIKPEAWLLDVSFASDGSVAAPRYTPPLTISQPTLANLLRPIGEVTMWFGNSSDCPAGWLICNGAAFSATTYPKLAALYDAAGLIGYNTPDMTDRFPIGAGSKLWSSSGGASTRVLTMANLPPIPSTASATATSTARVARGSGTNSGDILGSSTPVDILNPWRALWFIIRAS